MLEGIFHRLSLLYLLCIITIVRRPIPIVSVHVMSTGEGKVYGGATQGASKRNFRSGRCIAFLIAVASLTTVVCITRSGADAAHSSSTVRCNHWQCL